MGVLAWLCYCVCTQACPLHDYSSFHNGIVHSLSYGRISVFHLKDLHPATAVWEASRVSLVTFCTAFAVERESVCICALFSVLKMVSVLVLQIKSKRHRKSLKIQKAHRKVRNILTKLIRRNW